MYRHHSGVSKVEVNHKKSSLKKSFRKESPKFWHYISPVEKSPRNKKSLEIKSCHFETLILRIICLVSTFSMILYKNVPGKNIPLIVVNEWEQRMFTTIEIKGTRYLKHSWQDSICRNIEKKGPDI